MKRKLHLSILLLSAMLSAKAQLSESFDGTTFPPAGWTTTVISTGSGTNGTAGGPWARSTGITLPAVASPHSGAGMAIFDSYNFKVGSKSDLITPAINLSGAAKRVSFWLYRSDFYYDEDSLSVYINTSATATGATFLGQLYRFAYDAPSVDNPGWDKFYFDIPASFNGASNYIIFRGIGNYGESILLDDVTVANKPVISNDDCGGAVNINATNTAGNPVVGSTVNASQTMPAEACAGATGVADDDVWYEFTTNAGTPSGTITVTPTTSGGAGDLVLQVYSGTCGALGTSVLCADATGTGSAESISLAGLTASTHYYLRVYTYFGGGNTQGGFNITVSAGATVPINLASFIAQRNGKINTLTWTTAQEMNSSHFVVERSTDGRSFTEIGQVAAAGTSSISHNYVFTDSRPMIGLNYYRLKLVDKDNSVKYSSTRSVRNEGLADIAIYPNPVKDMLTVNINADKAETGSLMIADVSGKVVYSRSVSVARGATQLPLNISTIAAGAYMIKIQLNNDVLVRKFNKL